MVWKSNISAKNYYLAPLPLLPPPYASPVVAGPGRPRPQHCLAETVVKHFLVFIFLISCSIPTLPAPPLVLVLVLPLLLLALEAAVDVSCLEGCKNKKLGLMFFLKKVIFCTLTRRLCDALCPPAASPAAGDPTGALALSAGSGLKKII